MVLAKPENKHVTKGFSLAGRVAVVTGEMWLSAIRSITQRTQPQVAHVELASKYLAALQKQGQM